MKNKLWSHAIDFAQGPFEIKWDHWHGIDFIAVVNAKGELVERFGEEHQLWRAEGLVDWLNAKHEGGYHPIPPWYKDLLESRARRAHNIPF